MIPYAILAGALVLPKETIEFRILDLSILGFTFRVPKKHSTLLSTYRNFKDSISLQLSFYQQNTNSYETLVFTDFTLSKEAETTYTHIYRIETENSHYYSLAQRLSREYLSYISLKQDYEPEVLANALTNYPLDAQEQFPFSYKDLRANVFFHQAAPNAFHTIGQEIPETAIVLDRPSLWNAFLQEAFDDFLEHYFREASFSTHPFHLRKITHLYIGNGYCPLLFPTKDVLTKCIDQCIHQKLSPVLVLSTMSEDAVDTFRHLFSYLKESYPPATIELVVNDWGQVALLQKDFKDYFRLTLGILLNKRRKDARMKFLPDFSPFHANYTENSLSSPFFQDFLKQLGIEGFSYESCGYTYQTAPGTAILHLPFYQMNTATYCTLYSSCAYKDRSHQHKVTKCPHYCEQQTYLYPTALSMVGRYNTLFGYDENILFDEEYANALLSNPFSRIVLDLL